MEPELIKQKSQEYLRQHNIPINEHLPCIEPASAISPQNPQDIARRAVVLSYVVGIGFGQSGSRLRKALEEFDLYQFASAEERRLFIATQHTEQQKTDALWLVECVQALGWCLQLIGLDPFLRCDDDLASNLPAPFADPSRFIASAKLHPLPELRQQADLHYRLHWAAVECRLRGISSAIDESIIRQRRKALDWVIGVEPDWDLVRLDT